MICVDEFGPLNLLPRKGKAWRPQSRPQRLRASREDTLLRLVHARFGGLRVMGIDDFAYRHALSWEPLDPVAQP